MLIKIIFSITFFIIVIIYTFFPNIKIDSTTIALTLLVFVPWVTKYLKSFELTGIGKVDLLTNEEKEKLNTTIEEIILNNSTSDNINNTNINTNTSNDISNIMKEKYFGLEDPKLSLAALRIDIEEKLLQLARLNYLKIHTHGIMKLSLELHKMEIIDNNEYSIIRDIIGILNKAVHSKLNEYDVRSYNYIIDIGCKLLNSLNNKIKNGY